MCCCGGGVRKSETGLERAEEDCTFKLLSGLGELKDGAETWSSRKGFGVSDLGESSLDKKLDDVIRGGFECLKVILDEGELEAKNEELVEGNGGTGGGEGLVPAAGEL